MRQFAKIAAVQLIILLCGLAAIELALARFMPLPPHGGVYTDRAGNTVRVIKDDNVLQPNLDIVHAASEFRARIHTNALGYRAMSKESLRPDFLFLGDSFTFGHGVPDDEVFAEVFCKTREFACLNLARSGTDTFDQVRILRHGFEALNIRPKTVVLTMLAACWLGVAGNDLGDNLRRARSGQSALRAVVHAGMLPPAGDILKTLQQWVGNFEIVKRVMLIATGSVKASVYGCSDQSELDAAVNATKGALAPLAALAEQYGFEVAVVVVHPYQELELAYAGTEATVASALPQSFKCMGTGARLRKSDYYAYDGHFNASGHAKVATMIGDVVADGRLKDYVRGCRNWNG